MPNILIPDYIQERLNAGREFRRMAEPMQIRAGGEDDMIVEGYATTFNQPYELWSMDGYTVMEQVDARAFEGCDMSDVIMQYDHHGRVFARNRNHTLELSPDQHGLKTIGKLRGTELGRQVYQEVQGGYSDRMSFSFTVEQDSRVVTEDHDTGHITVLRTIQRIKKLYDVSIVSIPANDATEIYARGLADGEIGWAQQELLNYRARIRQRRALELKIKLTEVQK